MNLDSYCNYCGSDKTFCRYFGTKLKYPQIKRYCETCGHIDSLNFKYSDFEDINKLKRLDYSDRKDFYDVFYNKIKKMRESDKREYYRTAYLKSNYWKNKRKVVLKRDDYTCRFCKRKGYDIHHITYKNLMIEEWNELITLCRECHKKCHSYEEFIINGLYVNYGKLKVCGRNISKKCKIYHNGASEHMCDYCKIEIEKMNTIK